MKKILIIHAIPVAIIVIVGLLAYSKYWNIALVNGQPISRLKYIQTMDRQGGKQVLDELIDEALIVKEGDLKGVKVEDSVINEEITKIEDRLKSQGQTIQTALAANNLTRADLEYQIRLNKIQETLSASKAEISSAEIDEFLTTNKDLLPPGKTPEELKQLAKEELILQANQASASAWLDGLRQSAKVIYK